jgi:hypothetical protein
MLAEKLSWGWGAWVLGDMAGVLRRASDVLGHSSDVVRVVVEPPSTSEDVPKVTVVVPNERSVRQLRDDVAEGQCPAWFSDASTDGRWIADLLDLQIVVTNEGP